MAIIKNINIEGYDPFEYKPKNVRNFAEYLDMNIGPEDQDGSHIFGIMIYSFDYIADMINEKKIFQERGLIVVEKYEPDLIISKLNEIVSSVKESDFGKEAEVLSKFFFWEYENYKD